MYMVNLSSLHEPARARVTTHTHHCATASRPIVAAFGALEDCPQLTAVYLGHDVDELN